MKITGYLITKATWKIAVCVSRSVTHASGLMIIFTGILHLITVGAGTHGIIHITHGAGIIIITAIMADIIIKVGDQTTFSFRVAIT
jgi:hypothetical protein